jgi:hypothetical protein
VNWISFSGANLVLYSMSLLSVGYAIGKGKGWMFLLHVAGAFMWLAWAKGWITGKGGGV